MRFSYRLAIALGAVVIFSVGTPGCQMGPQIAGPHTVERAQQLEKEEGKKDDALKVYAEIVRQNQRQDPAKAADALYRAGEFAQSSRYSGTSETLKVHGQDTAAQMWRQLRDDFPTQAKEKLGPNFEKYSQLASTIDQRNSKDAKYQIINTLVNLTGRHPYSYSIALIALAVMVKLILLPFTKKQYKAQREMQRMQPLIKELQKKYKGVELNQKTMELYKEHKVNPFAGCGPTLLQLPFLIFIFTAIREYEYAFANGHFLWIGSPLSAQYPHIFAPNLAMPDVPLLVMYTLTNYITMRMSPAMDPQQQQQQNTMALMTSGIFFYMFLSYKWSSAFVLYWFALNLLSIWQQYEYIYKPHKERLRSGGDVPPTSGNGGAAADSGRNGKGPAANVDSVDTSKQPARVRPRKKKK
jgi:YidC/Oxa1 family membrane protein insertase